MAIKDLQAGQGKVDLVAEVVEVGEVREFEKFGRKGKVANATIKDETGQIKLTLWNDDAEKVKAGDKISLTNCFVNEWRGEKQLTTGRFGKIEVTDKASPVTEDEKEESNILEGDTTDEGEHVLTEDEAIEEESLEEDEE